MARWRIRDYHADDIDSILRLWEQVTAEGSEPVYSLSEVLTSLAKDHAVVAVVGEQVVGAAVGRAAHAQGWVVFLATAAPMRGAGIGSSLLAALEARMAPHGISKLSALMPAAETRTGAFERQGFALQQDLHYFERHIPVQREELKLLAELGGRVLPRGLWDAVGGMNTEKGLLERRVVLPLAESELAERFGVVPPRAIVLFGPPGTGKTTFAKAIASRLEWSFVEVFPSRLAAHPGGLAGALRETFATIADLEHAVVFIDEVEEIASHRQGEPPSPTQGVTNELLKIIPAFREQPGRLLICATNFIRSLDAAFLRHGRFDYVIPIGLPDRQARDAIWRRYIPEAAVDIDVPTLVEMTEGFSPADIEFAARKASQSALENAVDSRADEPAGPFMDDYTAAIAGTRATVSAEVTADFLEDIETVGRL
ncbi:ATP-binding protein [Microbacterium istanbulense]|uniref:GNAT family N-acetyltransferase n=1 Tax=Microbacterium istanbulense TaxID=3122049 RepID=A0ABU8LGZ0_9MICO